MRRVVQQRLIRVCTALVLLGTMAPLVSAQPTPMPQPRAGAAAVALGGKVYVIGGEDARGQVLASMDRYDPQTDTWETGLPAPGEGRVHAAAVVLDGKIYLLGGREEDGEPTDEVEVFDPRMGEWTQTASMHRKREGLAAVVMGRRIFALGGFDDDRRMEVAVEYYDVPPKDAAGDDDDGSDDDEEGVWRVLEGWRFRTALGSLAAAVLDEAIYTFGGVSLFGPLNLVQRYRQDEGLVSFDAPLARAWLQAVVLDGKIYLIGGFNPLTGLLPNVDVFDPETRRWRLDATLRTPRWDHVAVVVEDEIYVMGGRGPRGDRDVLASVEMITPTGVAVEPGEIPAAPLSLTAHPSPFHAQTQFRFDLDRPGAVRLEVYDVRGRRVAMLLEGDHPAGIHTVAWTGRTDEGGSAPSGVYLARLMAGDRRVSTTLVRIR